MKTTPFVYSDGPLKGCVPANGISVDASLIGVDPVAGDRRFICRWDKSRSGGEIVQGLYRFVRDGDKVLAVHVPGTDDILPAPETTEQPVAPAPDPTNG